MNDDYIDEIDDGDRPICCPHHPDTDLELWEGGEWCCPEDSCDYVWLYPEEDGISDRERL